MTQRIDHTAESSLPPPKQFMSEEKLLEAWDTWGMKYRFDELHQMMLNRGLVSHVDRPSFRNTVFHILKETLVEGIARRDPRQQPKSRFPKVF